MDGQVVEPETLLIPQSTSRFAYVLYATNDQYAVSAMVAARILKTLDVESDADVVILHIDVGGHILRALDAMGVHTKRVAPLPPAHGSYFRDCLIKLRILQLVQYERVVFFDADALPLARLDELFTGHWTEPIAAPRAYWLAEPVVTSALLAVQPSLLLWERASRHFAGASENRVYDMDIVNLEFGDEIHRLPDGYICLNSEWEDRHHPYYFGDPERSYQQVKLVHFSALGKPWFYSPRQARRRRPNAHRRFFDSWDEWWRVREDIIKSRPFFERMRHRLLALSG